MSNLAPITTVKANGLKIAYELHGNPDAPVILLIHGLGMPMTSWPMNMVNELVASGFQVLRIDNRDQGRSERVHYMSNPNMVWQFIKLKLGLKINPPYALTELMKDTIGVLDALNIERVHIVGVSMGGMISQLVAIHYPSRVASLTSIMSTTGNRQLPKPQKEVMAHLMAGPQSNSEEAIIQYHMKTWKLIGSPKYPTSDKDLREYVKSQLDRGISSAGTQRQMLAILDTPNRFKELGRLSMPVQVIHGSADPLIPMAAGKDTAEATKGTFHLVEGMGHDLPKQMQHQICRWITEQANKVEGKQEANQQSASAAL